MVWTGSASAEALIMTSDSPFCSDRDVNTLLPVMSQLIPSRVKLRDWSDWLLEVLMWKMLGKPSFCDLTWNDFSALVDDPAQKQEAWIKPSLLCACLNELDKTFYSLSPDSTVCLQRATWMVPGKAQGSSCCLSRGRSYKRKVHLQNQPVSVHLVKQKINGLKSLNFTSA